ncbi:MAG TPA: DinB family protein, partial [Methylomirabilota bacterium]|nr:DinB family protein [Methylomirabilota bacterium]
MRLDVLRRELAQGAETIQGLVAGVSAAEARVRPAPDSWSILEVVAHLLDEEREDFRPRLDLILHRPEEKWAPIDPPAWVTARGYNDRELAATLSAFLAERERSLAWLAGLTAPDWSR